jgi:mRNA-degrading endonuclease RelE of RelBE toxin-antitoxin system
MSDAPGFRIALSKEALKYYRRVGTATAKRLDGCFATLESNPVHGVNVKPLVSMPGQYRYRLGTLRVVYEVNTTDRIV